MDSLPGHQAKTSGQGGLVAARCRPPLDARARGLVLAVFTHSIDLTRDRMPGPFAFVMKEAPIAGSPADKAGLLAGDAILRFGEATRLEELPDVIKEGKAVRVTAVETFRGGRCRESSCQVCMTRVSRIAFLVARSLTNAHQDLCLTPPLRTTGR